MKTRRSILSRSLQGAGLLALQHLAPLRWLSAQQPQHPDEMGVNTTPNRETYPRPDFGPPPKELPPETIAVSGKHSLKAHAERSGILSGAAVVVRLLDSDPALAQLYADQCGILVPENELKWRGLRPSADKFDFTQSDALLDFATKHHILVRGHTLAWHNSVPDWLTNAPSSRDVRKLFVDHITTVMSRYKSRIHSWDVVNEAIYPQDKQPGSMRNSFWYQHVGPDYIDLAYNTARKADPHAKLTYNDYGVEYDNPDNAEHRAAILELLRGMQARKVPLDAVGIQAHIKAAQPSTIGQGLTDYIEAIRSMGLEVYLTELDVNEDDIASNEVADRDRIVAETFKQFLDLALKNPAIKLVLTWGISDRRTWLNDGPTHHRKQRNRPQRSLPFDPAYKPTPAFFSMRDSFDRRGGKSS